MSLGSQVEGAWRAGLAAVRPEACVAAALAGRPGLVPSGGRLLAVAAGKAAAGMMRGLLADPALAEAAGRAAAAGLAPLVLLPAGVEAAGLPPSLRVLPGGHPHPTPEGLASTQEVLAAAGALRPGDRLVFLLSGGASALLEAPARGLAAADLLEAHRVLVASGMPVASINAIRRCLSAVKAGGLARAAFPAAVTTLAISDVEGDDPAVIGSGPTVPLRVPRARAFGEALALARSHAVALPAAVERFLVEGSTSAAGEAGASASGDYVVVASIEDAKAAALAFLASRGRVCRRREAEAYLRGDTREACARIVAALASGGGSDAAWVFGGETTVALPPGASGRGGRNLDLAARLALALRGRQGVAVAVAGTDGCDGSSRAAGALVDGGTAARAEAAGRPLEAALAAFDTEPALEAAGDLLLTGPTGTNVGDLVVAVA